MPRTTPRKFVCKICRQEKESTKSTLPTFCSLRCFHNGRKRTLESPYRFVDKKGYVTFRYWDDAKGRNRRVFEHRRVWELAYGPIPQGYVIHHINHIRSDNDLANLQLMLEKDHVDLHLRKPQIYPGKATASDYCKTYHAKNPEFKDRLNAIRRDRYNRDPEYREKKRDQAKKSRLKKSAKQL